MKYTLLDGTQRAKEHPDTFEIPPFIDRNSLPVGIFAKIGFIPTKPPVIGSPGMERMWVKITKAVTHDGMSTLYQGVLNNDPVLDYDGTLQDGTVIDFAAHHILDFLEQE